MEKGSPSPLVPRYLIVSALLLTATGSWSCSSSPKPKASPEVSSARPAALLPDAVPDLPPPPPIRELVASSPKAVKVISDGSEGKTQPSLIEASRMAKAKKRNEGEVRPAIEITDENLKDYSNGGQVFVLEAGNPDPDAAPAGSEAGTIDAAEDDIPGNPAAGNNGMAGSVEGNVEAGGRTGAEADRELFWRQSVSELRTSLRRAIEDLRRIELESTLLRQQFYSESDPFVRDSEVKPRWDRALDQLSTLRKKAKEDHSALTSLLAEAKKAGVPSGWLQDGSNAELTEEELRLITGSAPQR